MATSNGSANRSANGPCSEADYRDFARTGPGTLAGRYLRQFWQPVYLGRKLQPGHAIPLRAMSQDYTLYRGASGEVFLVDFRCAHRGTQLSTGWVEGDCLRCFYHGWKYDGTGQCVEMPAEDPSFPPKVRIRSYPVREYLGMVFAFLGEGEPPPFERWPLLEGDKGLEVSCVPRGCNYFQNVENTVDEVHVAFVHGGAAAAYTHEFPQVTAEETDYGIVAYGTLRSGERSVTYLLMPNCFMDQGVPIRGAKQQAWEVIRTSAGVADASPPTPAAPPLQVNVVWRVPIDDESHNQFAWRFLDVTGEAARLYNEAWQERERAREEPPTVAEHGEAILAGKLRLEDIEVNHFKLIQVQDWVGMVGQGRIADREHERLGQSDRAIILLRNVWERELRALAAGQPLKRWVWPRDVAAAFGR